MALIWDASLTDAGVSMISQWAQGAGDKLTITGAVIGEGVVAATQLHTLTQLTDQKSTISIQGSELVANGVKLKLRKTSQGITQSFILNQIGIYAKLDTSGGTPIIADSLIAVYQQDTGVLVPTEADSPDFVFTFYGTVQTNYQGDLTINVDTSALASQDDLDALTLAGLADTDADTPNDNDILIYQSATGDWTAKENPVNAVSDVCGAKNIIPFPYSEGMTKIFRGVTYTVADNGIVSTEDTATNDGWYFVFDSANQGFIPLVGTYKFSGCPTGGSENTYCITVSIKRSDNTIENHNDIGNGVTVTFASGDYLRNIHISVTNGTNMDGLTFEPMLYDARFPSPKYTPPAETNLQLTRKTSGLSNENLLDNPFFTVNQRGAITVTSGYGADRWRYVGGNEAVFSSSGVTLNSVLISQFFEKNLPNGTYTASALFSDGTIRKGTATKSDNTSTVNFIDDADFKLMYVSSLQRFDINTAGLSSGLTVRAVKLELGTFSTLANDVAPNYTTELLKCQRYFLAITAENNAPVGLGLATSAADFYAVVPIPTPMRSTPSLSYLGNAYILQGATPYSTTNIAFSILSSNYLQVYVTSSSLTTGQVGMLRGGGGGLKIFLSSDL